MINSLKTALLGSAVASILFAVSACSGADETTADSGETKDDLGEILLVLKTNDSAFFNEIEEGVRAGVGDSAKLTVRAAQSPEDVNGQRQILESLAESADWETLIITPISSGAALVEAIKTYADDEAKIVIVDTPISEETLENTGFSYDIFVGSSNKSGGVLAGELIAEITGDISEPSVLLLNGAEASQTASDRREGFLETFSGTPVQRTANWDKAQAREIVIGLLLNGSEFDAIFAANDEMALGAVLAYEEIDETIPPIIGFDATDEAKAAVNQGRMRATIAQDPFAMGKRSAEYALQSDRVSNTDELLAVRLVEAE